MEIDNDDPGVRKTETISTGMTDGNRVVVIQNSHMEELRTDQKE